VATIYSDGFDGDGALDAAHWDIPYGSVARVSGEAVSSDTGVAMCKDTALDAKATIKAPYAGQELNVFARHTGADLWNEGYWMLLGDNGGGNCRLYIRKPPTWANLAVSDLFAYADMDSVCFEAEGDQLRAYSLLAGVSTLRCSATDADYTGTRSGFRANTANGLDDWLLEDFTTPPPPAKAGVTTIMDYLLGWLR
jgi:hypothetical protein